MAKKSKTQRAKASAKRAARKEERERQENTPVVEEEEPKKRFSLPLKNKEEEQPNLQEYQKPKADVKPKKKRFTFLSEVRSEMRRVTWPTRQDVLQWSGVVIVALLFFGVFCVVLDDWVVTPILMAISGLGA